MGTVRACQLQNKLPGLEFTRTDPTLKLWAQRPPSSRSQPTRGMVGAAASCGHGRPETEPGPGGVGGGRKWAKRQLGDRA